MRNSKFFAGFLDAVNVAAVAVMAAVLVDMGREAVQDWRSALIGLLGFAVVFGWEKANAAWLVLGGALLGRVLWEIG